MNIFLNGEQKAIPNRLNVSRLLELLTIAASHVVIELNGTILQPSTYSGISLSEGDRLELIRFVGGG